MCVVLAVDESDVKPPVFYEQMSEQYTHDGGTARFVCKVTGSPSPTISWFHDSTLVYPSDDFHQSYEDNKAVLEFKEIFPEDTGLYSAVAKNSAGHAISSAELYVKEGLKNKSLHKYFELYVTISYLCFQLVMFPN